MNFVYALVLTTLMSVVGVISATTTNAPIKHLECFAGNDWESKTMACESNKCFESRAVWDDGHLIYERGCGSQDATIGCDNIAVDDNNYNNTICSNYVSNYTSCVVCNCNTTLCNNHYPTTTTTTKIHTTTDYNGFKCYNCYHEEWCDDIEAVKKEGEAAQTPCPVGVCSVTYTEDGNGTTTARRYCGAKSSYIGCTDIVRNGKNVHICHCNSSLCNDYTTIVHSSTTPITTAPPTTRPNSSYKLSSTITLLVALFLYIAILESNSISKLS